jgi:hypothetical protein
MPLSRHGDAALSWGIPSARGQEWLQKHFQRSFKTELEYMLWLGETASLKGNKCIQANCISALALAEIG